MMGAKTVGWTETETMIFTRAETETVILATPVCSSILAMNQTTETAKLGTTDVTIRAGYTMTRLRDSAKVRVQAMVRTTVGTLAAT